MTPYFVYKITITYKELKAVLANYLTALRTASSTRRDVLKLQRDVRALDRKITQTNRKLDNVNRKIARVEQKIATPKTAKVAYYLGEIDAIPENADIYTETQRNSKVYHGTYKTKNADIVLIKPITLTPEIDTFTAQYPVGIDQNGKIIYATTQPQSGIYIGTTSPETLLFYQKR